MKRLKSSVALCLVLGLLALTGCGENPPQPMPTGLSSELSGSTDLPDATQITTDEITSETEPIIVPEMTTAETAVTEDSTESLPASETTAEPTDTTAVTSASMPVTTVNSTENATSPMPPASSASDETPTTVTEKEIQPVELIEIASSAQSTGDYFSNPYRDITHIGDPYVLYDEASGKYYMYCTGGYFKCWSSDSFSSWTYEGEAYSVSARSFGTQSYWAPEVYKYNGAYYMVYSAARKDENSISTSGVRHSIGLARAESPTGPFTDVYDHPIFAPDYSVIDASLLFDDDGKIYLYYARDCSENIVDGKKTSQIYGIELAKDLSGTVGEPVLLATPTDAWELQSGSTLWNEGPCVFKRNGTYYLLYTANYYASDKYSVGYATATSPLGNYVKSTSNPILRGDGIYTSGTGHCSVTASPDGTEMYMVYHSHADVKQTTNPIANRTPCFDKLIFHADGSLSVNGPSVAMQPIPSGANGLYKKYDGVTVTSTLRTLAGSTANLTDGVVPFGRTDAGSMYRFADGDGCIRLTYDTPINLHSLWIYGMNMVQFSPKNVYAVVNGTYKTKVRHFSTAIALTPVVLTFDGLPAGTKVEDIKLYFTCADGAGNSAALGEIITVVNS